MPQAALPTANERTMLRRRGLKPRDYYVIKRLNYVIILKHRITGAVKFVDKRC